MAAIQASQLSAITQTRCLTTTSVEAELLMIWLDSAQYTATAAAKVADTVRSRADRPDNIENASNSKGHTANQPNDLLNKQNPSWSPVFSPNGLVRRQLLLTMATTG